MRSFLLLLPAGLMELLSVPPLRRKVSPSDGRGVLQTYPPPGPSDHPPPQWGRKEISRKFSRPDPVDTAHIGPQCLGDQDRTVRLLIIFPDRHQRAANRKARAVERVHKARGLLAVRAIARIHPPRLEVAAIGAG